MSWVLIAALWLPLGLARRWPVAAAVAVYTVGLLQLVAGQSLHVADAAVLVALYLVTARGPRWAHLTALVATLVGSALLATLDALRSSAGVTAGTEFVALAASGLAVWAVGLLRRVRREQLAALRDRAERLEREADRQAQIATAIERARIAREMHDLVAHSLSVIIAQADGGRYAGVGDPAAALRSLGTISETGRAALGDMRAILGVLRKGDEPSPEAGQVAGGPVTELAPQPAGADLEALVKQTQEAGLKISLVRVGTARQLPAGAGLTLYRICQEALTNVLKHAGPGPSVTVLVRWAEAGVDLTVSDDGRGASAGSDGSAGGGHGLLGMRERASMFGGTVTAGPRPGGGFQVQAHLPLPRAAATGSTGAGRSHDQDRAGGRPAAGRAGFRMVIDSQPDLTVVAEAGDGTEALRVLAGAAADVVLMDVRMPGMDGLSATEALVGRPDAPKVIVLTTFDLDEYVLRAIKAGASGFLLKDAPPEEMLSAIRTVHAGDAVIAPSSTRRLIEYLAGALPQERPAQAAPNAGLALLTDREREVLLLIARGRSNAEIQAELVVAEATVKTHVGRVLAKLGARDRVQAVVIAYEAGLVRPGYDERGDQDPTAR